MTVESPFSLQNCCNCKNSNNCHQWNLILCGPCNPVNVYMPLPHRERERTNFWNKLFKKLQFFIEQTLFPKFFFFEKNNHFLNDWKKTNEMGHLRTMNERNENKSNMLISSRDFERAYLFIQVKCAHLYCQVVISMHCFS